MEFPFTKSHFNVIYENLRHICVTFNSSDPLFIYHLVNAVTELISPKDRLYFLIEMGKLNPDNFNLILNVLKFALQQSKKETIWNFINFIIFEKKIRFQCIEFWQMYV